MEFVSGHIGVIGQDFIDILLLSDPQRIVAQTDGHAAFPGFTHEPSEQLPPLFREDFGMGLVGQSPEFPALVAVGVIDLQTAYAVVLQQIEVIPEVFAGECVPHPPVEGDFAVSGRGIPESGQDIQFGITAWSSDRMDGTGEDGYRQQHHTQQEENSFHVKRDLRRKQM